MGRLRIQLINEYIGSLNIETDDPIDINELTQTVKRSADTDGIMYEIVFDLDFIKGARKFLMMSFLYGGGIDAVVFCNIFEEITNKKLWIPYGNGRCNFNKRDLTEDRLTVNIEQIGLQRQVINMMKTDVDLETVVSENGTGLPPINLIQDLELHAKDILKESAGIPSDTLEYLQTAVKSFNVTNSVIPNDYVDRDVMAYGQFDTSKATAQELEGMFNNPYGWTGFENGLGNGVSPGTEAQYKAFLSANKAPRFEVYRAEEAGFADVNIRATYQHTIIAVNTGGDVDVQGHGDSCLGNIEIKAWFEHRDKADNIKTLENFGTWTMPNNSNDSRTGVFETKAYTKPGIVIEVGDKIYVYETVRIFGRYERPTGLTDGNVSHTFTIRAGEEDDGLSFINIVQKTQADPSTTKAFLLFETMERILQFITNQVDCFKSNLLGRTDLDYPVDGDGSLIAFTNGHNIRGRSDKRVFTTLEEVLGLIDSLFCVGLGFETDSEGVQRVILEKRPRFYDKNTRLLSFDSVYDVKESILPQKYYNLIEYGYSTKLDVAQTNAIDEFNTLRRSTIPVTNTKNQLKIASKVIAGGYQIETQRRLINSTKDNKLDEQNFIIVVVRKVGGYKSKKDEGYESILNVYSPSTGYNYDVSPARSLRNWLPVLASSLIYAIRSKILSFSYGEVNYEMISKKTGQQPIAENGDVDISNIEPLWDNMLYTFSHACNSEEFSIIKANPYGYIEFTDLFGVTMQGFVSEQGIEHDANKGVAEFKLLKVYRP